MTDNQKPAIIIDDQPVPFKQGDSVLAAAHRAGVYIPHLCFHPELSVHGSCKLCTVEVQGRYQSACLTAAENNLQIRNHTPALTTMRKQMIELLFAEGNHFCPSCELSGNCQLQAMAYELGMDHSRFPLQYPSRNKDGSHPDIFLDRDRCINCALCCRASQEIDGKQVFSLGGRGKNSHLQVNASDGTLGQSDLLASDKAANICPVGALFAKQHNYSQRPGERLYDTHTIAEIGNQRPAQTEEQTDDR